ncbi:MAG: hypothetical protein SGI92_30790 [Bryobacteraceae bacterium]|nr:hypothetical protein [Bryobacteraceae bacterium]
MRVPRALARISKVTPRERWFQQACKHLNINITNLGAYCNK